MPCEFQIVANPGPEVYRELESLFPANVFYTRTYAAAMRDLGSSACILALNESGRLTTGCTGFVRQGRFGRSLEIPSLPPLGGSSQSFWAGLTKYCSDLQVSDLELNSFGSPEAIIPIVGHEASRSRRIEFVLDLKDRDLWHQLDKKHRQSIHKARQANVSVRCSDDLHSVDRHMQLMKGSLERHQGKGEKVSFNEDSAGIRALLTNGAAKLYQAVRNDDILSSATILRSSRGAYYHTAGNDPQGLTFGASHLMLHEISLELAADSVTEFNLGGTDPAKEGLVRFKSRFGARRTVELEAASFYLGSKLQQLLLRAARKLRNAL